MVFSKRKVSKDFRFIKYEEKYGGELLEFIADNAPGFDRDDWQENVGKKYLNGIEGNIQVRLALNKDGEIIGFSRAVIMPEGVILVLDLCVKNKYSGNHVGEALMQIYKYDFSDCYIGVVSKNNGFYRHLGGVQEGTYFYIPYHFLEMHYEYTDD